MKMDDQHPIVLVSAGDDNYAMPLAVSLYSALTNLEKGHEVQVYVIDGGISIEHQRKIEQVVSGNDAEVQFEWLKPDHRLLHGTPEIGRFNKTVYYPLLIPELLQGLNRAIFLDGDVVVEHDISKLWRQPLEKSPLGAVRDYGGPYAHSAYGLGRTFHELGMDSNLPCFNTGVLLLNLELCREENVSETSLAYLRRFRDRVRLPDQEALNAAVAGNWFELDPRWNSQIDALQNFEMWEDTAFKEEMRPLLRGLMDEPYVYHFIGGRKPWKAGLVKPGRRRFMHYLRESGWFTRGEYRQWRMSWLWSSLAFAISDVLRKPTIVLDKLRERLN